jgi:site-specific recombinase XerD
MAIATNQQAQDNVVIFDNGAVYNDIQAFLRRKNIGANDVDKLEGTAAEYNRDINRFFKMMGKQIETLTIPQLDMNRSDIERFQVQMTKLGYKSSTINRNTGSLKSLYNYFEENRYKYKDQDNEWVYIKGNMVNVDDLELNDQESYGIFTNEEVQRMIKLAKDLPNGITKSLAIELASVTSFRIEAVTNIKHTDFRFENNTWVAKVIDKDKINEKSINTDLFERMMANMVSLQLTNDRQLFNLTSKTLERTIKTLTEKLGLDQERNLTFHSLKKYGMREVYDITGGDFMAVKGQGNHESFETSQKYYLEFSKDYSTMPSLLIGQTIDMQPLQELSKEELLKLIESCGRGLQYQLLNKLGK